jgi:hypothetical protein
VCVRADGTRYQLEMPDAVAARVPSSYDLKSQRKGFRRYTTRAVDDLIARLCKVCVRAFAAGVAGVQCACCSPRVCGCAVESHRLICGCFCAQAEEQRAVAVADTMRRLFERFSSHYDTLSAMASTLASLDALMSLALWSAEGDHRGAMCRCVLARCCGWRCTLRCRPSCCRGSADSSWYLALSSPLALTFALLRLLTAVRHSSFSIAWLRHRRRESGAH